MKIPWTQGERNDTNAQLGRLYVAKSPTVSLAPQVQRYSLTCTLETSKGHLTLKKKKKGKGEK